MAKIKILAALILLLTASVAAQEADDDKRYNSSIDLHPSQQIDYAIGKTGAVNITVEINTTASIDNAYLQTDEALGLDNYTRYTDQIEVNNNGTDIHFVWDNQEPVVKEQVVDYRPFIVAGGKVYSTPKDDNLTIYPDKNFSVSGNRSSGDWIDFVNVTDENSSTYAQVNHTNTTSGSAIGYFNYSKPIHDVDHLQWKVKDSNGTHYLSLEQGCIGDPVRLKTVSSFSGSSENVTWSCLNQSSGNWTKLLETTSGDNVYFEQLQGLLRFKELNTTIDVLIEPEIESISAEDVKRGGYSSIRVNATHPVGRGEIDRVEFLITTPNETTDTYIPRKTEDIRVEGDPGNTWETIYTETSISGEYRVEAVVYSDEKVMISTTSFTVSNQTVDTQEPVRMRVFSIGGTITSFTTQIRSSQTLFNIWIGLILLNFLTTGAILAGGGGYEETEYSSLQTSTQGHFRG